VRVIVRVGAVVDLAAGVTALHLNGGMPDVETLAQPALDVAHDVLRVGQRGVGDHDVAAEGHGFG